MKRSLKTDSTKINLSKVSLNITHNYKDADKESTRHTNMNKPTYGGLSDSQDIIPAYAHDYGNYVARYGLGNFQIQVIIKLDGKLDYDKLSWAVRLCVDEEPVLGCRFVEHNPPYFKRLKDIDKTAFCSMEETDNVEEAVNRFLEKPLNMDHDPMVKVKLIRSDKYDTMGIKINHCCSDGSGTKDFINLLANIYSCIDNGNSIFVTNPRVRSRKDHEKVFKALGIKHPELADSTVEFPKTVWPFPWKSRGQKDITPFVICQLPSGQLDALSKYAKERGATINDLILTAFYRAMFELSQPPCGIPMDIGLTVDLRRYLPDNKAEAIRNFSGGIVLRIPRVKGESFEGTLSKVVAVMNRKKEHNPGYQSATGAERAEKSNFYYFLAFSKFLSQVSKITSQNCLFCSPGLSNVGIISKSLIKFGEHNVTEAFFIPPVVRVPGLLLVASSYNGIMTLASGYYKGSINRKYLEKLLNKVKYELMEGCR